MTWKRTEHGWERACRACRGTGKEHLGIHSQTCGCPLDHCDEVDHPANTGNNPDDKYRGIWWKVVRCDHCGQFWCVYFEVGDDSWDVPGPEALGRTMPPDDWRPDKR